ncbi:MAG: glycolate oxidase subunit GlcE [Marinobacterium sp.]
MSDLTSELIAQVRDAVEAKETLAISAGCSKTFIGRQIETDRTIDVSGHTGIVSYQPVELVMTARAGTTLAEIESALAENNQMLACEPPRFGGKATLGGTLATNVSGPGRPWYGSIRDHVLGVTLINGESKQLRFGGQVMKNVAGYDLSRLQAGAMGGLGLMTEISLKVLPKPATTRTLKFTMDQAEAIQRMNSMSGQPKPITAAYWSSGELFVRLAGAASAVDATAKSWGGEELASDVALALWSDLQDQKLAIFNADKVWRFSMKSSADVLPIEGDSLINWGGAERWYVGDHSFDRMVALAEGAGGQVSLYRGGDRTDEVLHPVNPSIQSLQQRIKASVDPQGVFNPGRAFGWL